MGLWDDIKQGASNVYDAAANVASSVVNKVEDTARAVEQKVEQTAQAVGQAVENTVTEVKHKVTAAEQKAWNEYVAKQKAAKAAAKAAKEKAAEVVQDVKDEAGKIEQKVEDAAGAVKDKVVEGAKQAEKAVEDEAKKVEEGAKAAEEKVVKFVSSLAGPITKILPPDASGASSIFGWDDDPNKGKPAPDLSISYLSASIPGGKPATKVAKKTPVTVAWDVLPPKKDGKATEDPVLVTIFQVTPGWIFDDHDKLVDRGASGGSRQVVLEKKAIFKMTAWVSGPYEKGTGKDERSIEVEVDEDEEWDPEQELEPVSFEYELGKYELKKEISAGEFAEIELGIGVSFSGGVSVSAKGGAEESDKPDEQHVKEEVVRALAHREFAPGGALHLAKVEGAPGDRPGLKLSTGVKAGEKKLQEIAFGLEYTIVLDSGISLKVEADALKMTRDGHHEEKVETKFLVVGGKAELELSLAGLEIKGKGSTEVKFSVDGKAKVELGAELSPNWSAIARAVFSEVALDALISVGFVAGGVACIVVYAKAIMDVEDLKEVASRVEGYADGFSLGYCRGLSAQGAGSMDGVVGVNNEWANKGLEAGMQAGMSKRGGVIQKLNQDGKDKAGLDWTMEQTMSQWDDWYGRHFGEIRSEAKSIAEESAREVAWEDFGSRHMSSDFNEIAMRNNAFRTIFHHGPDEGGRWNQLWRKYCTPDTREDYKQGKL